MREIQTAENKTLKLTNVVSRRIQPEEFNNMQIVLTQMHNFIKIHDTPTVKASSAASIHPNKFFMSKVFY